MADKKNRDSEIMNDERQRNISRQDSDQARSGLGRSEDDLGNRQDRTTRGDIERDDMSREVPGNRSREGKL